METIYAIRIDHVGGYVSRYMVNQVVNGCRITEIIKDNRYFAQFKSPAYKIQAEDEDGTPFQFKGFEGKFSGVEVTYKKPNTDDKEMKEMLKMAGYYD